MLLRQHHLSISSLRFRCYLKVGGNLVLSFNLLGVSREIEIPRSYRSRKQRASRDLL